MPKTQLLVGFMTWSLIAAVVPADDSVRAVPRAFGGDLRPLFSAIRHVETGALARPREAVGDGGRSIGPYQISRAYWSDSGVGGDWRLCRSERSAESAMLAYWKRYCPEALRRGDYETLARVHNGGPTGHTRNSTRSYWTMVRARLLRQGAAEGAGIGVCGR